MIEKRKLTQYEKMMLASAYNIKNYCRSMGLCEHCIFSDDNNVCVLMSKSTFIWENPDNMWKLADVNRGDNDVK